MAGMKDKGPEQVQSPVTGSATNQNLDGSKKIMEGGEAQCEDPPVTHPVQSDDPDNKGKVDVPHKIKCVCVYTTCGRAGGPLAFCSSVFCRSAGILWILLIILSVLTALTFHHCYEDSTDPVELPEMRVMMLGKTGTGKSTSGNTILGREAFKSEASALPVTKSCDTQSGVVEGRNITVIDTPAITTGKAAWLSGKVDPGPHVFLFVIPLRRFTEEDGEEVKWIQTNFGEEALKFTIILFTGGDQMDQKNAEQFLKESSGLQTLVNSTGGGYHIFDNKTPRGHGQVKGLLEKIELLLRKNMGNSYSYALHEQVKTAVREEEERKRREDEEERKRREVERERKEEERERKEAERERREEERKEEERKRGEEEHERKGNEEERKRREVEREKREEDREKREEDREKREGKREIREEDREKREEKREIREDRREVEEEKKRREEEKKRRENEEKRREEESKRREEEEKKRGKKKKKRRKNKERKRGEERTKEQRWNFGNMLNGFIGFVLRDILEKFW